MIDKRAVLLLAALALAGCIPQETARFDFTGGFPSYNPADMGSIQAAAEGGDGAAARLLGDMYYWGDQVEPDRAKAEQYWVMGAEAGDAGAIARIEALRNGWPVKVALDGGGARRAVMSLLESQKSFLDTF
ncbi:MAG: SEL1-like repeat protein [Alphaproteobacteria bacterium]